MEERKYYVYAWYAKTTPKRYFYVGKGTGRRYSHILYDIQKYKNGSTKNTRFQKYSQIQDRHGIDYEIILSNLTECEALFYEQAKKFEFLENGEILLNVEGIPEEHLPAGWYLDSRGVLPTLHKDPFFERYFDDYRIPYFDKVEREDLLRTYVYPYFVRDDDPVIISDKALILDWLHSQNAKIYKTVSAKNKSVIIQGYLMFDRYSEYREAGIKIFSSKDVIDYINQNPS